LINGACDIIEAGESAVVFGFKFPFHAEKAGSKENLAILADVMGELMSRQVTVECVHAADVTDWKQRETAAARSPLVRAAQEMGARIIEEERPPDYGP
jgi:hypothetical protein